MIRLDLIDPNPYQPREKEDPEHIAKIAASIAVDGLMQVPVGRWYHPSGKKVPSAAGYANRDYYALMVSTGWRVQLAFGHSRLAACKLLAEKGYASEMPVNIRDLEDEEMFRQGISENLARKDLTPLETARAMARYRDEFGKTSAQIGEVFGLNEATVRGKIRLLNLPESIQASAAGASELVIRELVTVFDLPEDVQARMEKSWARPSELARDAGSINAAAAATRVNQMLAQVSKDMSGAPWKFTDEFPGQAGVIGPCKGCRYRLTRDGKNICLQPDCYNLKLSEGKRQKLAEASQETGIAIAEDQTVGYWDSNHFNESDRAAYDGARTAQCPNLRLLYQDNIYDSKPGKVNDYALAVCLKRKGQCTCMKAATAGIAIVAEDGKPVSEEALKQVAREARQQKRDDLKNMEDLRGMAATAFGKAAARMDNYPLLRMLLHLMGIYSSEIDKMPDRDVLQMVGKRITDDLYEPYQDPDPIKACAIFNRALVKIGQPELETPWTVSVETPVAAAPAGKSMMAVFVEQAKEVTAEMLPGETLIDFFKRTDPTVHGPDCEQCGKPMKYHRKDEDGWTWYHCEPCDTWKGSE